MTRGEYLARAIRLYLQAPDTPKRPRRRDWAIASDLYNRSVPLDHLDHAIRLATLRRKLTCQPQRLEPIHSLAYYRAVLDALPEEALEPGYVDYVSDRYRRLLTKTRLHRQNPALLDRR